MKQSQAKADWSHKTFYQNCIHQFNHPLSIQLVLLYDRDKMPQQHRAPPYRAEHLGSLKRTDELLYARHMVFEEKAMDKKELTKLEERDVKEIVQIQKELGFHAVTDGEYRRHMFWRVQPDESEK